MKSPITFLYEWNLPIIDQQLALSVDGFYGGVDEDRTLAFGTPDQVRAEIHDRAEKMSRGGGYILQSSHTILDDVSVENIVAYIDACHELAGIDTQAAAEEARRTC